MFSYRTITGMLLGVGILLTGCRSARTRHGRPSADLPDLSGQAVNVSKAADSTITLFEYADAAPSRHAFLQFEVGRRGAGPREYERKVGRQSRMEGSLVGRVEFPLSRYLDPHSRDVARPQVDWPGGPHGVDAFFVEFDPPITEWPFDAVVGDEAESEARLTAFERDGVPFAYGTCRRTTRVAGRELIQSGEQTFGDAVRMEAETEMSFGWMATMRVQETVWFARGVGLVRREERFNGRALWLFRFAGASRYELADTIPPHLEMVSDEVQPGPDSKNDLLHDKTRLAQREDDGANTRLGLLSRVALCFDRTGRRIRLSGLAAEYREKD